MTQLCFDFETFWQFCRPVRRRAAAPRRPTRNIREWVQLAFDFFPLGDTRPMPAARSGHQSLWNRIVATIRKTISRLIRKTL